MAINEKLTADVRRCLSSYQCEEKRMFRGISFMLDDRMLVSVGDASLLVRVAPDEAHLYLKEPGVQAMMMRGKEVRGWILVSGAQISTKKGLARWIARALRFHATYLASRIK